MGGANKTTTTTTTTTKQQHPTPARERYDTFEYGAGHTQKKNAPRPQNTTRHGFFTTLPHSAGLYRARTWTVPGLLSIAPDGHQNALSLPYLGS